MDIKEKITAYEDELLTLRRDFHQHPELGYEEHRTASIVTSYLEDLGLEVKRVCQTGVVGLLRGGQEGKTVMLRADLDALPQQEANDLPYRSVNEGVMHACGHDGHTAVLLVAAKILASLREQLHGNIKFVFQPNEEEAGALDMIKEGVLENPKVDAAFGLHLWTPLKSGEVGLNEGPVMSALEEFELELQGQAGHTGSPHKAIDPIIAAASIIQNLQTLQTRETDPLEPVTIMIGSIQGGSGRNIIADTVKLGGTIRFLFKDEERAKKELLEKLERLVDGICHAMRVTYSIRYIPSNPSLLNDPNMVPLVRSAVVDTYGSDERIVDCRNMAGEDFAEFSQRVPSVFYFIGTGNEEKGTHYPHHHPQFNIDEDTLKFGVELHVRAALRYLNQS